MSFIRDILFYHISNVAGGEKWLHMFFSFSRLCGLGIGVVGSHVVSGMCVTSANAVLEVL